MFASHLTFYCDLLGKRRATKSDFLTSLQLKKRKGEKKSINLICSMKCEHSRWWDVQKSLVGAVPILLHTSWALHRGNIIHSLSEPRLWAYSASQTGLTVICVSQQKLTPPTPWGQPCVFQPGSNNTQHNRRPGFMMSAPAQMWWKNKRVCVCVCSFHSGFVFRVYPLDQLTMCPVPSLLWFIQTLTCPHPILLRAGLLHGESLQPQQNITMLESRTLELPLAVYCQFIWLNSLG